MANRHTTLTGLFNDIADAIRSKGVGSTDGDLKADDFDTSIGQIVTLKEGTSGDTASAGDILSGKKAHTAEGEALTGTMANNGATGGTITSQGGTYTIPAGYTSGGTVTANLTSGNYTPSVASHSITTTPVVTPSVGGTVANIITATKPSGTDGTDYWTLDPGGSVTTTGKSSTTAKAIIRTAGYLAKNTTGKTTSADVIDITPTVAAGTNSYIKKASTSSSQPTASATNGTASVTKNPTASASVTTNGFTPLASGTSTYYVTASASSASGTVSATGGSASTTAGSVTVGAGYNPSEVTVSVSAKSASGTSASTTEKTASDSKTIYIPEGSVSVSASKGTVSSHSVTVTPKYTNTAGYIPAHSTAVSGTGVSVSASELVSGNKALSSGTSNQTGIDVTNYATVSISAIASGSATTPATTVSVDTSSGITWNASTKTITVSKSGTKSVTPTVSAGYVSTGTAGTITASASGSKTLTNAQLAAADSNISAGNIKKGVTILGVTGTYTSDATAAKADIVSGKTAYVNGSKITGTLSNIASTVVSNNFTAYQEFTANSDVTSSTSISSTPEAGSIRVVGGVAATGGIKGSQVYNAVWNDLADAIPVNDECNLEYGYCYCFDGEKYYKSNKYLDDGIIGIHSDTAGFVMGTKGIGKEMQVAVAGFVLAYVDKEYKPGTLLTCAENGHLTEISKQDKIENPEKIVASFWKPEIRETWGSQEKQVQVNGRMWVKIR